jgi:hypothetical protein
MTVITTVTPWVFSRFSRRCCRCISLSWCFFSHQTRGTPEEDQAANQDKAEQTLSRRTAHGIRRPKTKTTKGRQGNKKLKLGDHANDQSKEGRTFDKSRSYDHRTANVASNFWLTSHALNSSSTNLRDTERCTQHDDTSTSSTTEGNQRLWTSSSGGFLSHRRYAHRNNRSNNQETSLHKLSHNKTPLSSKTHQSDAACLGRPAKPFSEQQATHNFQH